MESNPEPAAVTNPLDAEVCARIPISFLNTIQPHGYLLVLDKQDLRIVQLGVNLAACFNLQPEDFLGQPLAHFVMAQAVAEIRDKMEQEVQRSTIPLHLLFSTRHKTISFLALLHYQADCIILELEELRPHEPVPTFVNVYQQVKLILSNLKTARQFSEVADIAAQEIKRLSGFDRVMIYRFDRDWNGTVIAESLEPDLHPYLDLRFPASDIPKQARELYLRTPYRIIPDAGYVPVPLVPELNPVTNSLTDLSESLLRGVAGVHLEYLANMGVRASMSTAILKDGQLWGLISCHHRTAKYVPYELRSAFELLASILSSQLAARESEHELQRKSALTAMHARLLEQMSAENNFVSGLLGKSPNILDFLGLSGAVIQYQGQRQQIGEVPSEAQTDELLVWLQQQPVDRVFSTESLASVFEPAAAYASQASGLIALPLSADKTNWLLGFRPEVVQLVKWGGDPNQHVRIDPKTQTLHPRNSFDQWKELVRQRALPFEDYELEMAATLRNSILEVILRMEILKRMVAEEEVYKLSIVAAQTDNAVLILNKKGQIEWFNDAFSRYTQVALKEAMGRHLQDVIEASHNLEEIGEIISRAAYSSSSFSKDISIERDSKRYYINFNFTPVTSPTEEVQKLVGIGSDITSVREYAEQLELINKELDKFAYIVAHDLKAPLRSIEGLLNALEGNIATGDHDDTPELLEYLQRSVRRMDHLITQVLSYSRIGRVNMEAETVDLHRLLHEVIEWLAPPAHVSITIQEELPQLCSVKVDLQQIFSNLIGNAIKYGHPTDCRIEIKHQLNGHEHEFTVQDNGPGIAQEYHQHIFEMFRTLPAENDQNSTEHSTGIGLATVKKLVEDKGGRIWVESALGKGAAFTFTLPEGS